MGFGERCARAEPWFSLLVSLLLDIIRASVGRWFRAPRSTKQRPKKKGWWARASIAGQRKKPGKLSCGVHENSESRRRSVEKKGAMWGLLITGRACEHAHPCTPMKGALVLSTSRSHRGRNYKGQQLQWDGNVSCIVLTLISCYYCMKYMCKRTQTYNLNACNTHMFHWLTAPY